MLTKLIVASLLTITSTFLVVSRVSASPYGIGIYNAVVPYGGPTQITVSTSGTITIPITPTSSGALGTATGTVSVVSTDVIGYNLYISSLGATTMDTSGASLAASANSSPGALAVNTWGYNLDGTANFTGITATNTLIRSGNGPYTSGDTTSVTYGVNVNLAKPAGIYSTTVLYTVVPKTN